jgi:cytidine deaminase
LLAAAGVGGASMGCDPAREPPAPRWKLTRQAEELVADPVLRARMFAALDAAEKAGTDPSLSKFHVRAATVIEHDGAERAILGGNSEYAGLPEAIHGETSLLNHVINAVGPAVARRTVDFIAFHSERCGGGGSCGDCRDYLMTTTRWQELLVVCGQATDHAVHVRRFAEGVVPEDRFPQVGVDGAGLASSELEALTAAARAARDGGVRLFTSEEEHLGLAALSTTGKLYRAAGADDAAFHYRYPVGAVLQQAATYRDYFLKAVVVAGSRGRLPRVSYRDRQYGYEFSSFNRKRGLAPIRLILVEEGPGAAPQARRYRLTTFEDALPGAFSASDFLPGAVDRFLGQAPPK